MSKTVNNQSKQRFSAIILQISYAIILGVLFLVFGLLEIINYLSNNYDVFNIPIFDTTEGYIVWSENIVMGLAYIIISMVFFWAINILRRGTSDKGRAYLLTGISLAVYLLIIFLLIDLAENIGVFVDTVNEGEKLGNAEWVFSLYSPIYLGTLSVLGLLWFRKTK